MSTFNIVDSNPNLDFKKIEDYILSLTPSILQLNIGWKPSKNYDEGGIFEIMNYRNTSSSFYPDGKKYCSWFNHSTITDIFRLCKFYYPEITIIEVYNILINNLHSAGCIVTWICSSIRKRTWDYRGGGHNSFGFNSYPIDEYGVHYPTKLNRFWGYGNTHGKEHLDFIKY